VGRYFDVVEASILKLDRVPQPRAFSARAAPEVPAGKATERMEHYLNRALAFGTSSLPDCQQNIARYKSYTLEWFRKVDELDFHYLREASVSNDARANSRI
jgi:hypothetical protein